MKILQTILVVSIVLILGVVIILAAELALTAMNLHERLFYACIALALSGLIPVFIHLIIDLWKKK